MDFSETRRISELDKIAAAQTRDALWRIFESEIARLGFPMVIYLFRNADGSLVCRTNLSPRHYGPAEQDPFLKYCCDNLGITFTGPEYLPKYDYIDDKAEAFIARARRSGMTTGIGIPVRSRREPAYGGFNLGTRLTRKEFEAGPAQHAERLRTLCMVMQDKLEGFAATAEPDGAPKDAGRQSSLTGREREILALLSTGLTRPQIADRTSVSRHTIDTHVKSIYRKLKVHSQRELMSLRSAD
ncbi:LuxR C-terminal-related transcriptional regulator [Pseudoblastomonas halimionae]|uniref:LuxR C-terminal-related transcriptional regulator n=1 Tax=Alteriqipengyuania halimionae TaxID=1926630 RepID=UPI00136BD391|nr:LuxR family transcriptional regulator [Alteriqipengyuania halimionae]